MSAEENVAASPEPTDQDAPATKRQRKPVPFLLALAAIIVIALAAGGWYLASQGDPALQPAPANEAGESGTSKTTASEVKTSPATNSGKDKAKSPDENKVDEPKEAAPTATGEATAPSGSAGSVASNTSGVGGTTGASGGTTGGMSGGGGGSGSSAGTGGTGGSGGTTGSGSSGASPPAQTWHPGWNEWVVDVAGHYETQVVSGEWDEEIGHWGDICNVCYVEVTGSWGSHVIATGHSGGYSNYHWFVDNQIHHDAVYQDVWIAEQGHNVWHEGYWS